MEELNSTAKRTGSRSQSEQDHAVRLAVLEERTMRLSTDHENLAKEVRAGFSQMEKRLEELLNKNSVVDFLKENWKTMLVVGVVLMGKPTADTLEFLLQLMKGFH